MTDPTPETLANRKAGMQLMEEAALRGDELCLMTLDLMRIAEPYYVNTAVDQADEEDGWDDVREF